MIRLPDGKDLASLSEQDSIMYADELIYVDVKFAEDTHTMGTMTFPTLDEFAKFVIGTTLENAKQAGTRPVLFRPLTKEDIQERRKANCMFDQNEQSRLGMFPFDRTFVTTPT